MFETAAGVVNTETGVEAPDELIDLGEDFEHGSSPEGSSAGHRSCQSSLPRRWEAVCRRSRPGTGVRSQYSSALILLGFPIHTDARYQRIAPDTAKIQSSRRGPARADAWEEQRALLEIETAMESELVRGSGRP